MRLHLIDPHARRPLHPKSTLRPSPSISLLKTDGPYHDPTECKTCSKPASKRCAKCFDPYSQYCSRDCRNTDWKNHKKTCGKTSPRQQPFNPATTSSNTPNSATTGSDPSNSLSPPKDLDGPITRPFSRLDNGTWLLERLEKDVYPLLIDAYRLRVEDMYNLEGEAVEDSMYDGAADGRVGFGKFLDLVEERTREWLPAWWNAEKGQACEAYGIDGGDRWADLRTKVDKTSLNEHYGNSRFAMQLRMFTGFVYGDVPGGAGGVSNGMHVRKMMAAMEGRKATGREGGDHAGYKHREGCPVVN